MSDLLTEITGLVADSRTAYRASADLAAKGNLGYAKAVRETAQAQAQHAAVLIAALAATPPQGENNE